MAVDIQGADIEHVSEGLISIARALHWLGTGDAYSADGAVGAVAVTLKDGLSMIAGATAEIAAPLDRIAEAIEKHALAIDRLADLLAP
jgi:hypothetical protein